jgi:tRNA nucleotidyltransferase/poly(A) polymerase
VQLPAILNDLKRTNASEQPLYLVGGAVRDDLLGRPCRDYDIVCARDVHALARRYADQAHAEIYTLDGDRMTYRVLLGQGSRQRTVIDFATMQGNSIESDLGARDFTINAMAVDLAEPGKILDPYKGGRDLQEKWLRPVSANSFTADPLRVIRAIRYAVDLDLKLEPTTSALMRVSIPSLVGVSKERKRDELFRIMEGRNVHTAFSLLQHFHVFNFIPLIVKDDFPAVLSDSRVLEELLAWVTGGKALEKQAAFHQVSLFVQLGRFKDKLREQYFTENTSGRTRKALLFLTMLIETEQDIYCKANHENLALSVEEMHAIESYCRFDADCSALFEVGETLTPVQIFDFFRATGSTGVDLVFACLAKYRARPGVEFEHDEWLRRLSIAEMLLEAWWEKPEIVHPEPLLNGDEIMLLSGLAAGPIIGKIRDALIHQQVAGAVTIKKQAEDWLAHWLLENRKP